MAHIDYENNIFVDGNGQQFDLSTMEKVMVPRTAGGYSPGWIFIDHGIVAFCILEEKPEGRGLVRTKIVPRKELIPLEKGVN